MGHVTRFFGNAFFPRRWDEVLDCVRQVEGDPTFPLFDCMSISVLSITELNVHVFEFTSLSLKLSLHEFLDSSKVRFSRHWMCCCCHSEAPLPRPLQNYPSVTADVQGTAPASTLPYPEIRKPGFNASLVYTQFSTDLVEVFQERSESVRAVPPPPFFCFFLVLSPLMFPLPFQALSLVANLAITASVVSCSFCSFFSIFFSYN